MDNINNNQFEVKPISKRKITPCPNVYLNPALDLLANEDRICNTVMEIPVKKRKRTKSCDVATFENSALDVGVKPVNEVLVREIDNVRRNVKHDLDLNNVASKNIDSNNTKVNKESVFKFVGDDSVDFTKNTNENKTNHNDIVIASDAKEIFLTTEPIYANLNELQKPNNETEATEPKTEQAYPIVVPNAFSRPVAVVPTKEIQPLPAVTPANKTVVKDNLLNCTDISRIAEYNDVDSGISVLEQKSTAVECSTSDINVHEFNDTNLQSIGNPGFRYISNITNIHSNVTNQVVVNNSNLSLSFIDRLALDSPDISDRSLFYDDDLNESNIMEIKTITIITKKKRIVEKKNTNPFLNPNLDTDVEIPKSNPFLDIKPNVEEVEQEEIEYQEDNINRKADISITNNNALMPRRLFTDNTNSTISTVNESSIESQHEYENIDNYTHSPIYENIDEMNKQSKVLGYDVSQFSAKDILNLNKKANNSTESNESKKEKHSFFKPGKLSKKVFKTLKKTFKHGKTDANVTLNPYEVPRKPPKQKTAAKESGIENPALNLDNSDDLEFEELTDDEEHQYETIKTIRNTRLNMNVTPLRERNEDVDISNRLTLTPGKKVRFDSTLNQEKVITGNSFDCSMASPGFDAKIDKYHDELENCINERKFLQQNM